MHRNRYSRRAIFLLCCLAWIVGACAQSPAPVSSVSSPLLGPYHATPFSGRQPTGKLTLADTGMPTALNPLFSASRIDLELSSALWAAPVVFDAQFHVQPDQLTEVPLPENGDVQDGGKLIIMHLRHDLRWSDEQPILASDFAYWWHLDQNPDTGAITTGGYDQIASIATPDDYTVVLHLKQPFGPYLSYLPYAAPEHAWGHFQALALQDQPSVFQAPTVTDGPYKLALFTAQQGYTLVPNTDYHSTTFHGPFLSQL
ncbi:MAG TPA: ABC transporter substrate-binding protein, partial [Ktedonobacteraceae bacterium]|nr:ABC transporter substrate-binding protein [Ktedonobacteraceae bacterium]